MKAYLGKMANNTYQLCLHDTWEGSVKGFATKHIIIHPSRNTPVLKKGQMIPVCLFVDCIIPTMEEGDGHK